MCGSLPAVFLIAQARRFPSQAPGPSNGTAFVKEQGLRLGTMESR